MSAVHIIAATPNEQGDLLTHLAAPFLRGLGYQPSRSNVAKTGREIDIIGNHRYEHRRVLVECKSGRRKATGTELNKFAGKIDAEARLGQVTVAGYFVSLAGFTGPAIEQEAELSSVRMILLDAAGLRAELVASGQIVAEQQAIATAAAAFAETARGRGTVRSVPDLVGHQRGWLWAVYRDVPAGPPAVYFVHGDGTPLTRQAALDVVATARQARHELGTCVIANVDPHRHHGDAQLRAAYLDFLTREFGDITLEGLPADHEVSQGYFNLDALYEPVRFSDYSAGQSPAAVHSGQANAPEAVLTHSLGEALAGHRRLALLGLPGCGKTTILKRLAIAYADLGRRTRAADALPDLGLFPVLIRCRHLSPGATKPIRRIIAELAERIEMPEARDDLESLILSELHEGRLLLLIDGLDEIADPRDRLGFALQLRTFLAQYPACRIVITSREAGFRAVAGAVEASCHTMRVQELTDQAIRRIVHRWQHEVAAPNAAADADRLTESILDATAVRSLATTPLLLTTLLVVQRSMGGGFQVKRTVLYEKMIEVLIRTWNTQGHAPLEHDETVTQLAYTAYHMMVSGKTSLNRAELTALLEQARQALPTLLDGVRTPVQALVEAIELRSSLLASTWQYTDGRREHFYEFKHLTFQEYLAALAIARGWVTTPGGSTDVLDLLKDRLSDDIWQEVVSMATVLSELRAPIIVSALLDLLHEQIDAYTPTEAGTDCTSPVEPAVVTCLNLMTCLRDGAGLDRALAADVIRATLDFSAVAGIRQMSLGRALHGGRYDPLIRQIAMALYQTAHPAPIPVAGELAHLAANDCITECKDSSDYDGWIMRHLGDDREEQRILGAAALMRIAFASTRDAFTNPPQLPRSTRHIYELIQQPHAGEDRLLLINLWAAVWSIRYRPPTDTSYLNKLQVTLARLAVSLQEGEHARMAAWALYSGPPRGRWRIGNGDREALLEFARVHTKLDDKDTHNALQRARTRAGFMMRYYLDPRGSSRLIEDLRRHIDACEINDCAMVAIMDAARGS